MVRLILPMFLLLFLCSNDPIADDAPTPKDDTSEDAASDEQESEEATGAGKRAAKDEEIAALVEQHNEEVDSDLDEVVCERVRITGTRRKVQVCKTKREIIAEQESAKRLLRQRNRASSGPAQAQGSSAGNN